MRTNKTAWEAEKSYYSKLVYSFLFRRTRIIDIFPEEMELGYTSASGDIHLAYEHPVFAHLSDQEKAMFRFGVLAHELLHQLYTNFSYLEEVLDRHTDRQERRVLSLFANLVEDPSIEFFAPQAMGGKMLEALRFSIRHIYRSSPPLEESETAFGQLINAFIMFGDMGLLKGEFTFPEAKEYFLKIAPEFDRMVTEPDPVKRVDAAEKWMILTRPLWKQEENLEETVEELLKAMGETNGSGEPDLTAEPMEGTDACSMRRRAFSMEMSGESDEADESEESSEGKSGEQSDSDGTEESRTGSGHGDDEEQISMFDPSSASSGNETDPDDGSKQETSGTDEPDIDDVLSRYEDDGTYDDVNEAVNSSLVEDLEGDIERERKTLENEEEDTLDYPVTIPRANGSDYGKRIKCLNYRVSARTEDAEDYGRLKGELSGEIKLLTSSLKTIFRADLDEYIHSTSGRYNIKRDLDHTRVKVFDKKKERKNVTDLAVFLLVDCSGSMSGTKIQLARNAAVVLAETFKSLSIPCYIMGFTADDLGHNVVHPHYVGWKNTPGERASLVRIKASANNDDGYSIRYAAEVLKKKKAEHNILFVISDGSPACMRYTRVDGIKDTALAIKEAGKVASVFGIGIGMRERKELKDMYKGSYVSIVDVRQLTSTLANQLKRIIRKF